MPSRYPTYIKSLSELPKKEHFAVLRTESIYIPGDERSRTNPGHGYPEHTEIKIDYLTFESEEHLLEWIRQEEASSYKKEYQVICARPVTINKAFSVSIQK